MNNTVDWSKRKCSLCSKPVVYDYRPFCSERCKQVDLGHWFMEKYRIPGEEQEETTPEEEEK
jgi:endogenous inhibitor of DNA gyrase (YacG/DUF329 family)